MKLTLKLLCVSFLIVCLTALALAQGAATGDLHVSVNPGDSSIVGVNSSESCQLSTA